jgi:hypothetical protein
LDFIIDNLAREVLFHKFLPSRGWQCVSHRMWDWTQRLMTEIQVWCYLIVKSLSSKYAEATSDTPISALTAMIASADLDRVWSALA